MAGIRNRRNGFQTGERKSKSNIGRKTPGKPKTIQIIFGAIQYLQNLTWNSIMAETVGRRNKTDSIRQ